jgi:hypothetical protein
MGMSPALQVTQEPFNGKLVGLSHVFERAKARQITTYACGFAVYEDPGESPVHLQDLVYC